MATKISTIKANIKAILEALQRQEILRDVQVDDLKKNVFTRNFSKFPVAILTTPATTAQVETNTQNMRTYAFEILVLLNRDEITDSDQVEDLIDTMLNAFDNDVTLKGDSGVGAADGGSEPSSSGAGPVEGTNYTAFSILVRAKAIRDITLT